MKATKPNKKPRATNVIRDLRIQVVLLLRLEGAEGWDIASYVSELEAKGAHPWKLDKGDKPLSDRQIRRYVVQADQRIAESCRTLNPNALPLHLAQRQRLYAKAVNTGDLRSALIVLKDLANLQGLYPAKKLQAKQSGDVKINVVGDDDFYDNRHGLKATDITDEDLANLSRAECETERSRLEAIIERPTGTP